MGSDCIFCKIIRGDIPANKLYEDDDLLAFWDISPQAPKHFLVIPKRHIPKPTAISADDEKLVGMMLRKASELAVEKGIPESFRFVMNNGEEAGQTVFHIHLHVLGGRPMSWPPG